MTLRFTFDGQEITCSESSSIAAALTAAGHRAFRETEKGACRGIFCGMGVCQDCLVTVDGRPNQRACMTPVHAGADVKTQPARPSLTPLAPRNVEPRRLTPEVLVVGGGAGGLSAAITARQGGAEVVLLDERKVPGGQFYKQSANPRVAPLDDQQTKGQALVQAAQDAGVTILSQTEVWGAFDGPEIMAAAPDEVYAIAPESLIVATGAYQRPVMIPGWTLPGVMTVGAAQTLWRSYRTLPGKRVALFGNGPLTAQVALELAQGGAEVVLLAEAAPAPWKRPLPSLKILHRDRDLARKGLRMLTDLRRLGVQTTYDTLPAMVCQTEIGLEAKFVTGATERSIAADAICLNYGFQPQNEVLRLLGAEMYYDPRFDQLRVYRSDTCETSIPGVYAIGDCCGLGGAPAAVSEGCIAGRAAIGALPRPEDRADLSRHRAFQDALWQLYAADLPLPESAAPETYICRCEEVTKEELDAALDEDPIDIGALKRATRIGMGRCQGRYCAPAVAGIMARRHGRTLEDLSYFAPRVPIKPVDIAAIAAAEALLDKDS